jgi:hypothetical protein
MTQISEIRRQLARTEIFRGFRSMPIAFSGLLALAAAGFQSVCLVDPQENIPAYLTLWLGAAVLSAMAAGIEIAYRYWNGPSSVSRDLTCLAVEQFLPCLLAGGLVTLVLALFAPENLWLLPGLWQILFSLGIFATYRLLPRPTLGVAMFYMVSGVLSLILARGEWALSPWAMGIPFGLGQLYAAGVLYWTLERTHGQSEEQKE